MNKEMIEALIRVQQEMPVIKEDANNPHFKSSYATLAQINSIALPIINKHGFVISHEINHNMLKTTATHTSGDQISSIAALNPTKNDPQGTGGAVTYYKRYNVCCLFNIATTDDDGNTASKAPSPPPAIKTTPPIRNLADDIQPIQEGMVKKIIEVAKLKNMDGLALKGIYVGRFKKPTLNDLSRIQGEELLKLLEGTNVSK